MRTAKKKKISMNFFLFVALAVICSSIETASYQQTVLQQRTFTPPAFSKTISPTSIVEPGAIVTVTSTITNNDATDATITDAADDQLGSLSGSCVSTSGLSGVYTCVYNGVSSTTASMTGLQLQPGTTVCTLPSLVCGNAGAVLPISSTITVHTTLGDYSLTAGAPITIQDVQPSLTFTLTSAATASPRIYYFSLQSASVSTDPLTYTLTSNCPLQNGHANCFTVNPPPCYQTTPARSGTLNSGGTVSPSIQLLICADGNVVFSTTYRDDEGNTGTQTISLAVSKKASLIEKSSASEEHSSQAASIKLRGEQEVQEVQQPIS